MRHGWVGLALVLVVATGCGGSNDSDGDDADGGQTDTTAATPTDEQVPIDERCGGGFDGADPEPTTFTTSDDVELFGVGMGTGTRGVVLLHGTSSSAACNWGTVAPALAADGYRVLALDHRCQGYSGCPEGGGGALDEDALAGVAELRAGGAETVTVIGESRGGAVALATGARDEAEADETAVDAVVALSPVDMGSATNDAPIVDQLGDVEVPTLLVMSRDDGDFAPQEFNAWMKATPQGESVVYDARGHGALMMGYEDGVEKPYRDDLVPFLEQVG